MNVYIISLNYKVPFEKIMEIAPEHRAYLNKYYEDKTILLSGIKCSHKGGIIILRANNEKDVEGLIKGDPFHHHDLADYDYVCMESRRHQPFINEWMHEEGSAMDAAK